MVQVLLALPQQLLQRCRADRGRHRRRGAVGADWRRCGRRLRRLAAVGAHRRRRRRRRGRQGAGVARHQRTVHRLRGGGRLSRRLVDRVDRDDLLLDNDVAVRRRHLFALRFVLVVGLGLLGQRPLAASPCGEGQHRRHVPLRRGVQQAALFAAVDRGRRGEALGRLLLVADQARLLVIGGALGDKQAHQRLIDKRVPQDIHDARRKGPLHTQPDYARRPLFFEEVVCDPSLHHVHAARRHQRDEKELHCREKAGEGQERCTAHRQVRGREERRQAHGGREAHQPQQQLNREGTWHKPSSRGRVLTGSVIAGVDGAPLERLGGDGKQQELHQHTQRGLERDPGEVVHTSGVFPAPQVHPIRSDSLLAHVEREVSPTPPVVLVPDLFHQQGAPAHPDHARLDRELQVVRHRKATKLHRASGGARPKPRPEHAQLKRRGKIS
mmetsp:Transcript_16821/g.48918  ORF Transcript_16821/g.48918 Transcript_16821/m.48918 type:complete len:440 (-) Transcript_16821:2-1321(-)